MCGPEMSTYYSCPERRIDARATRVAAAARTRGSHVAQLTTRPQRVQLDSAPRRTSSRTRAHRRTQCTCATRQLAGVRGDTAHCRARRASCLPPERSPQRRRAPAGEVSGQRTSPSPSAKTDARRRGARSLARRRRGTEATCGRAETRQLRGRRHSARARPDMARGHCIRSAVHGKSTSAGKP